MALYYLILVLLVAKLIVGRNQTELGIGESRVIGGKDCDISDYPYIVKLKNIRDGTFFCSGILIKPEWILTAANCFEENPNPNEIVALSNPSNLISPEEQDKEIEVKEMRNKHPFDITLVKLKRPVKLRSEITELVKLPRAGFTDSCTTVNIMGWSIVDGNQYPAYVLQCTQADLIPTQLCKQLNIEDVTDQMVCTNGSVRPCYGDVGGPLVCHKVVIGVVSKGACEGNDPALYTKIEDFLAFIPLGADDKNSITNLFIMKPILYLLLFLLLNI